VTCLRACCPPEVISPVVDLGRVAAKPACGQPRCHDQQGTGPRSTFRLRGGRGKTANLMAMARRGRRGNEPPAVRPVDVDGVRTVAIGTVLWAVAFVVLAVFRDELSDQGVGWWLWTCLAGVGLGLLGLEYTRKRRDAIARARLREEADRPHDVEPGGPGDLDLRAPHDSEPVAGRNAEPLPVETETEPELAAAEQATAIAQSEPVPAESEPVPAKPEPTRAEPRVIPAEPKPPAAQWTESGLLDVGPLVPAPPPVNRRARRAARADKPADDLDDEPLLPMAWGTRPAGGRRARRDDSADEAELSEGDAGYRGRRARGSS
jgi:Protein of unknown function (DUF2530)